MKNSKDLSFVNPNGQTLSGELDWPIQSVPDAYAIFAHCFACSKHTRAMSTVSQALTRKGIAVLRFDFTGIGSSEGDFSDTTFSSNVTDLVAASGHLKTHFAAPTILVGHSFGGMACLKAAAQLPEIKAVATIGSAFDPRNVRQMADGFQNTIEKSGAAPLKLAGQSFQIKRKFLEDLDSVDLAKTLPTLNLALLVLHSPVDDVVSIENAEQIYRAASHPKSLISLDTADHFLSRKPDADYAGCIIAQWAERYINTF
jgi:alpha-beta hydrolase superfamily lysophospholipase